MDLQNFKDMLWELLLVDAMEGYIASVEERDCGLDVRLYGGENYVLSIKLD